MQRHMTIRSAGFASALPFVAGVFGSLFGGQNARRRFGICFVVDSFISAQTL